MGATIPTEKSVIELKIIWSAGGDLIRLAPVCIDFLYP